MAANTSPIFTLTPVTACVAIATANANRDGTGTIGTVLTAGANGTRIHRINLKATVTTTAGTIRLYIYTGAAYFLWREITNVAITVSATVPAWEYVIELFGESALVLPTGYSLRASTEKAENHNVVAEGGDY
ncbi:MAG: hypothetical protein NTW69_06235 [Chloroflexi bacterium]|nr:hypothetical protein [Chloroflexota bacterium]